MSTVRTPSPETEAMKVLFIVYQFPPLNIGGSHRPFKFVKHLHAHGITPVVITPEASAHGTDALDKDPSGIPDSAAVIIRTPVDPPSFLDRFRNSYYLNTVDPVARRWRRHVLAAARAALQEHDIRAVVISIPPFSTGAIGVEVARMAKLPLLLDLRDAWTLWLITPYVSYLHFRWRLWHERRVLRAASCITVTSAQTITDLQRSHPDIEPERYRLVTNGYDQPAPELPDEVGLAAATRDRPFTIGYVGSFYYTPYQRDLMFKPWWRKKPHQYLQYAPRREDWLYRSPWAFFRTLERLRETRPDLYDLLNVEFMGEAPAWLEEMRQRFGLADKVTFLGRADHESALRFQARCDALLITSSKVVGGRDYSIAGKTFEYLAQGKPMVAFVSEGAQRDLLLRTGMAIDCPPDDPERAALRLTDLLEGRIRLRPDKPFIRSFHIERITESFAAAITETANAAAWSSHS